MKVVWGSGVTKMAGISSGGSGCHRQATCSVVMDRCHGSGFAWVVVVVVMAVVVLPWSLGLG